MEKILKPSKYQQAIYDYIKKGNNNIIIDAVAGSGKSSTIVSALDIISSNKKKIFLAFNKSIVEELKTKISTPNTTIQTLHSVGFSVMVKTYRSRVDNWKYKNYLKDNLYLLSNFITIDSSKEDEYSFKNRVFNLLNLSRASLLTTEQEIEDMAFLHDISLEGDEVSVVKKMMDWGINQVKAIDFTDMIWIPVVKNLRTPLYDWVMIDEAQDLNLMQNKLFQMLIEPKNGKFIAVGDPKQSINFFCGADNESFENIAKIPNTIKLPLSICYRCPKLVVQYAKKYVPQIEFSETAIEGEVNEDANLFDAKAGDMVISRVTAPLVSNCLKFIGQGIPAYVKGHDMGINLKNIVIKSRKTNVEEFFDFLDNELYKIQIYLSRKLKISMEEAKDTNKYMAFKDKIEVLHIIAQGCINTAEICREIDSLFKDESQGICFSTIHKAKGLEADNVFVIALDKLPLKKAMSNPIQKQQEYNLCYVAYTRSKKTLNLVQD